MVAWPYEREALDMKIRICGGSLALGVVVVEGTVLVALRFRRKGNPAWGYGQWSLVASFLWLVAVFPINVVWDLASRGGRPDAPIIWDTVIDQVYGLSDYCSISSSLLVAAIVAARVAGWTIAGSQRSGREYVGRIYLFLAFAAWIAEVLVAFVHRVVMW